MSKRESKMLRGARQALAFARRESAEEFAVHVPETVDVRAIRKDLGLSQREFAMQFGFTAEAVRNWEQGRRRPEGPARILLKVIQNDPEAVKRALV
jgi:putative transcriptional regulator